MIGVVDSYDPKTGRGQIAPEDGGSLIAVFASEVERAGLARLTPGQRLAFTRHTDKSLQRSYAVSLSAL